MTSFRKPEALHPTEGARFLLELDSPAGASERVTYRATIYTPSERFEYRAELALQGGGQAEITAQGQAADSELESKLATIAKLVARGAQKRIEDGLDPWPHRILRWKGPGRG